MEMPDLSSIDSWTSIPWTAPEILDGQSLYTKEADVYSLGMTILELITGKIPWDTIEDGILMLLTPLKEIILSSGAEFWRFLSGQGTLCGVVVPDNSQQPESVKLMSVEEIVQRLSEHGCRNITSDLDFSSCSTLPETQGGFGEVYRGKLQNGLAIAIKTAKITITANETGQKALRDVARELHVWSKCDHPNVLPLLGLVEFRQQIGMASLWMRNGNTVILKYQPRSQPLRVARVKVHGDLKGLNVLVSDHGVPMITDFGSAFLKDSTFKLTSTTPKNGYTLRYAAPELLDSRASPFSMAADLYALGMTILEVFTGRPPFHGTENHRVIVIVTLNKEIPPRPEKFIPLDEKGDRLWSFLSTCWANKPDERPSARELVELIYRMMD
ncbi:Ephrin type-A receptor 4 [Ceratobasidium sp. AG-Ba]|nr:Ephrin type-A receptor 4 [Ceratobasidium sp. AG-Ba]